MQHLDAQLREWTTRLNEDVKIPIDQCQRVATLIQEEVKALEDKDRAKVLNASPVPLDARVQELQAFQSWTEAVHDVSGSPPVVRAHVITQNYVCFVYLKDACFEALRRVMPSESVTKRCCKFLVNNPVRAFRNAVAHGNWKYMEDYSGIEFWSYKGRKKEDKPMPRWEASQQDLDFWQDIAKVTAYSSFTALANVQN